MTWILSAFVYSLALRVAFSFLLHGLLVARQVWRSLEQGQGVGVKARAEHGKLAILALESVAPVYAVCLES